MPWHAMCWPADAGVTSPQHASLWFPRMDIGASKVVQLSIVCTCNCFHNAALLRKAGLAVQ